MNSARPRQRPGCRSPAPAATSEHSPSPISSSRACPPTSTPCLVPASPEGIEAEQCGAARQGQRGLSSALPFTARRTARCATTATARARSAARRARRICGFKALYGNHQRSAGDLAERPGEGSRRQRDHRPPSGNPGFPNTFDPSATPVARLCRNDARSRRSRSFTSILPDAHDNRSLRFRRTFGPGEAGYVAQLKAYDTAFGKFFARLTADGITKDNTLFVVVPDENDHFVGGTPSPANCDGVNVPCTYAAGQKGEIDALINRLAIAQRANTTAFSVHSDDAPTVYVNGNPGSDRYA